MSVSQIGQDTFRSGRDGETGGILEAQRNTEAYPSSSGPLERLFFFSEYPCHRDQFCNFSWPNNVWNSRENSFFIHLNAGIEDLSCSCRWGQAGEGRWWLPRLPRCLAAARAARPLGQRRNDGGAAPRRQITLSSVLVVARPPPPPPCLLLLFSAAVAAATPAARAPSRPAGMPRRAGAGGGTRPTPPWPTVGRAARRVLPSRGVSLVSLASCFAPGAVVSPARPPCCRAHRAATPLGLPAAAAAAQRRRHARPPPLRA